MAAFAGKKMEISGLAGFQLRFWSPAWNGVGPFFWLAGGFGTGPAAGAGGFS